MKYYRDLDYYVYHTPFPRMGVPGVIAANTNGTVNIYINSNYTWERQQRALRHELRHFARGHLWNDVLTLTEKELEADDDADPCVTFAPDYSWTAYEPPAPARPALPCFRSLDALRRYVEWRLGL